MKKLKWFATRGEAIRTVGSVLQVVFAVIMLIVVVGMNR